MKVKPVILCGGTGTRLFPGLKKNPSKQFIDFGGWTLFDKTLKKNYFVLGQLRSGWIQESYRS